MGTGKSAIGRLVAERLGFAFVDTDTVIEERAGKTIAALFDEDGEAAFRQIEQIACCDTAAHGHRVIAVGGGALLNPQTRAIFEARGLIVCLDCDLDEIIRRVGDSPSRPLYNSDHGRLAQLWESRAAHYASFSLHIDTTTLSPEQAAEEVIRLWQQAR
jgi:shikimate kinase